MLIQTLSRKRLFLFLLNSFVGFMMIFQFSSAMAQTTPGPSHQDPKTMYPLLIELDNKNFTDKNFEAALDNLQTFIDDKFNAKSLVCDSSYKIRFKMDLDGYPIVTDKSLLYSIYFSAECGEALLLYWSALNSLMNQDLLMIWQDSVISPMPIVSISSGGAGRPLHEILENPDLFEKYWGEIDLDEVMGLTEVTNLPGAIGLE